MKKFLFLFLAAGALHFTGTAQSEKFMSAMKATLAANDTAKTIADFQKVANTFERIGDAEKTQWLPYYYAGLALSTAGWQPGITDKDANSEKINAFLSKAESLTTSNSDKAEIAAVRNMAATQQMLVDPQTRYMTYGAAAGKAIEDGLKLDDKNPRLYYLRGMSLFGTPPQFGGGKDKAKPLFEKAVALFKSQEVKPLYPHWGQQNAEETLAQCN